jgi:hypothetical protein
MARKIFIYDIPNDSILLWHQNITLQVDSSVSIDSISVITVFVDGHHSHLDISVLDVANSMGSRMVCLPAPCSYELQPVHESFLKSLKSHRNEALGI